MKILVTGPQGSGKTTQAKLLAEYLNIPFIGTGDALRKIARDDTSTGKKIRESLDRGSLVDDGVVAEVVKNRLQQADCHSGFIMDGYPRSMNQLTLYDPDFDRVFYLDISDEEVSQRLINRGREDDKPEIIAERLRIYHELTEPILSHYGATDILERVDGVGQIEEIQNRIREKLNG